LAFGITSNLNSMARPQPAGDVKNASGIGVDCYGLQAAHADRDLVIHHFYLCQATHIREWSRGLLL
jgi:hypothetical protein